MIIEFATPQNAELIATANRRARHDIVSATGGKNLIVQAMSKHPDAIILDVDKSGQSELEDLLPKLLHSCRAQIIVIGSNRPADSYEAKIIGSINDRITCIFSLMTEEIRLQLHKVLTGLNTSAPEEAAPQPEPKKEEVYSVPPAQVSRQEIERVIDHTPISQRRKCITVAVAGAGNRIGTTTQTIQFALFLHARSFRVGIIDMTDNQHLMTELAEDMAFYGIHVYSSSQAADAKAQNEYVVYDVGEYADSKKLIFHDQDIKIIVCGYKPWEADILSHIFSANDKSLNYVFSFVADKDHQIILSEMSDAAPRTFFSPYLPSMIEAASEEPYNTILSAPTPTATSRPGIFRLFGGRKE